MPYASPFGTFSFYTAIEKIAFLKGNTVFQSMKLTLWAKLNQNLSPRKVSSKSFVRIPKGGTGFLANCQVRKATLSLYCKLKGYFSIQGVWKDFIVTRNNSTKLAGFHQNLGSPNLNWWKSVYRSSVKTSMLQWRVLPLKHGTASLQSSGGHSWCISLGIQKGWVRIKGNSSLGQQVTEVQHAFH